MKKQTVKQRLLRRGPVRRANEELEFDGYNATVKFSARRTTLTIKVDEGRVLAMAPNHAAIEDVQKFLLSKQAWVREKLRQQQVQLAARQRNWTDGETLPLLGRSLELRIEQAHKTQIALSDGALCVGLRDPAAASAPALVQKQVQQWYREQAEAVFAERLAHWQTVTGLQASSLKVRTYKARWGSCSHRAEVSLNWKLMMAPPAVVDYVIVHELCHIVHFNHSPAFWQLVSRYQPHYKTHKAWLKGHGLSLEL